MSTSPPRVFAARLSGLPVFDPAGDQVGKIRDLVAVLRAGELPPRVLGLVVEVFGRRSVFVPMTRVTHVDTGQVITTGVVNMRRFEQRPSETLVFGQILDRQVTIRETGVVGAVYDVAMELTRTRDWLINKVAIQEGSKRFGRKGQTHVVDWRDVDGFAAPEEGQGATHLLAAFEEMRPADLASVIHDLPAKRRGEIAAALDDGRLADVLEELPEEDQVEILGNLGNERAADILEEMSPDDAADLMAELPPDTAERLLQLMDPEEADDVRRLMSYEERTAGGMMTTEPVILSPDATVADALAHVRIAELSPSLAALVYVTRPPLEPPTGRLLGVAHIQRLLREPPSTMVGHVLDSDIEPLRPTSSLEDCARHLATYNLVAAPVVDEDGRLVGAVTVDDLLDHLLPENWRDSPAGAEATVRIGGTGRSPVRG
ncbi:MAG TPA: CBS domain-containing protein [Nocardioidaceae bacterium]|nr:CBS domain-containing protein [Nocardioidaceae bacterium]